MHANKFQQQPQQPASGSGKQPLATSVFSGEARLRELEHLAETARKVRDQAAAELTRNGSTHHIARDRIAAAERMLRKTQQEITELRAKLGPAATQKPVVTNQPKAQEFELAMMLGHSKARFNRDATTQTAYEIQQDTPVRDAPKSVRTPVARHKAAKTPLREERHTRSFWRTLGFAALLCIGVGLGSAGTYLLVTTGSVNEAAQAVRQGTSQLVGKLRALLPAMSPSTRSQSATANAAISRLEALPGTVAGQPDSARETQEQQARAAAEQRLARQIATLENTHQTNR